MKYVLMSLGQFCEKTSGDDNLTRMKRSMTALFATHRRPDVTGDVFWNWLVATHNEKGVALLSLLRAGASIYSILEPFNKAYDFNITAREFIEAFNVITHISKAEDTSLSLIDNSMFKGESRAESVAPSTFDRMKKMVELLKAHEIVLILISHTNIYNYDYFRDQLQGASILGKHVLVAPSYNYPIDDMSQIGDHCRIAKLILDECGFSAEHDQVISCVRTVQPSGCPYVRAYQPLSAQYSFDEFNLAISQCFELTVDLVPDFHK